MSREAYQMKGEEPHERMPKNPHLQNRDHLHTL
jgi:hypothetical protein